MRSRRRPAALRSVAAALAVAPLVLAACAGSEPPPPCPQALALRDAARLVQFRGSERDLTDTIFEARITDLAIACEYAESDGKRTVEAEMQVLFDAEKGPANESGTVRFRYFVAVADQDRNILQRREFPLEIGIPGNQFRVRATETLSPTIPLGANESGQDYRVYVGFVLSPEQLEYNRRNPV